MDWPGEAVKVDVEVRSSHSVSTPNRQSRAKPPAESCGSRSKIVNPFPTPDSRLPTLAETTTTTLTTTRLVPSHLLKH